MYLQLGSLGRPSPSRDYLAMAGGSVVPRAGARGGQGGDFAFVTKNKSAQQAVLCVSCRKFEQEGPQLPFSMQVLHLHPAQGLPPKP